MIVADANHTMPAGRIGNGVVAKHRQAAALAASARCDKADDIEDAAIQCDIMQDPGVSAGSKNNDVFAFEHGGGEKYRD